MVRFPTHDVPLAGYDVIVYEPPASVLVGSGFWGLLILEENVVNNCEMLDLFLKCFKERESITMLQ